MCRKATAWTLAATVLGAAGVRAQALPEWRSIGNTSIDRSLAGLAGGPVAKVSFSPDGARLSIETGSGRAFETSDFETWHPAASQPADAPPAATQPARLPEDGAQVRSPAQASARVYAFGKFVYRSDNGGASWENLTAFRGWSIVGEDLADLAVSPANQDDIAVAGGSGVFRSLDGGKSWSGLNRGLANLPPERLLSLPTGDQGVRLALRDGTRDGSVVEWEPGQKRAWRPVDNTEVTGETTQRKALSSQLGAPVTATASAGDFIYAGMADGRFNVSADGGATWRPFAFDGSGPVERFWIDPEDPRVALAVLGTAPRDPLPAAAPVHVARTGNGGIFWDALTANLPDTGAHGIAADRATGAVYAATDSGVFMTYIELAGSGSAQPWTALPGLPQAPAMDVKLDAQGNQLWAALDGFGVYEAMAPHRLRDPRVVSSADLTARAAAPGSLVTVLGARVQTARADGSPAPVLDASGAASQIQIPFDASGASLSLAVDAASGSTTLPAVPIEAAAPAIFVEQDGSPLLFDAASGAMLDATMPAHPGARVQILATGLGRVKPDWPAGLPGPVENPPEVAAAVTAYLDQEPVQVTRAVLAPYIGYYLVEIEIPAVVNAGPAALRLEANGQSSNPVRIYIEP